MAATSSVKSMPTGHQVMHRPHPTHPDVPNWSIQLAILCVNHWRYCEAVDFRTMPEFIAECSLEKHEAHERSRRT